MVFINNRDDFLPYLEVTGVRMQTPAATVNNSTATLSRDTLKQLQQAQVPGSVNNTTQQEARAILICRPNSHPFSDRTLYLEPLQEVKVGRSVARNRVADCNAIFDCKVLSRNHALLWYNDGKFFIKDTGSSNGTFINSTRLSQTSMESEPYEVSSGDIVQFGVDVMENSRRETHGCIVAALKLYLPDGRETKASQLTLVGAINTKIPPVDLYRLNQYIQEANQREQILETKLISLQKSVESTKQNSSMSWQAMIDEDRLLSRIDMLEKKLQCFQKNITDDKLREEISKLHEEKFLYQNSAKEKLQKVHQEQLDASHKLSTIERALRSSEDECSLLREQLVKTHLQLLELTGRLDTLQNQCDEKNSQTEEAIKEKEKELANLNHEVNSLQEKIRIYEFCVSDEDDPENNSTAVAHWLMKSDIKNVEGSEDIIKAICNDPETEGDDCHNLEIKFTKLYKKILNLERNISMLLDIENRKTLETDNSGTTDTEATEECDGNQNMSKTTPNITSDINLNVLKRNFKHIKNDCTVLLKQFSKFTEDKQAEQMLTNINCEELESQLVELKQELEKRPTLNDYDEKQKLCDELNEIISTIRIEAAEIREQNDKYQATINSLEAEVLQLQNKENHSESENDKIDVNTQTEVECSNKIVCDNKTNSEEIVVALEAVKYVSNNNTNNIATKLDNLENSIEHELEIINHPDVEREEELIVFKEKYTNISDENIRLNQELCKIREDFHQFKNKSFINLMMYIAPIIVIIGYIIFNRVSIS